ncbi:MAG: hypothetical protein A3D31_04615 [Candidatus Fluviicola riflensis]|nr:MAG: hypothetical protein CHH17_10405 [Candidatus Fluviicola riflensis]OGS79259.1 MAG: hypothetical protein A3D31_04615 [Candidatus Fluviicola riflensis]OGS86691.1 MAG: hypothetical protein A2724_04075 [Fluviicola sp. RIFCSPHIGHO2_01_FULL_43_53]OGS88835.1 MAG: hypothetical protein A3E30_00585 [Fluviicola sp. RIFCSPHIGHO2_12_FULL_43_24]
MKKLSDFLSKLKDEKDQFEIRRTPCRFGFALFDSIHYVAENEWNAIVPESKGLMRFPYLTAMENSSNEDERFKYALIYDGQKVVAAAVFTIVIASGKDYGSREEARSKFSKIKGTLKEKTKLKMLICGHTHISGDHGFIYSQEITPEDAYHALADVTYQIRNSEKLKGSVHLQLIKDFYEDQSIASEHLKVFNYRKFKLDPNMFLPIRLEWKTFEDYQNALKSKYRTRMRNMYKQGEALERRILSTEEIEASFDEIQQLYSNVANKAKMKLNHYNTSYFVELKRQMKDDFVLAGYFLNGKMVGFRTNLLWGENCEAHAVGVDYEFNTEYNVYQQLLADTVKLAIELQKKNVIFGRTAMEMKSNLGAVPVDMYCYVRHAEVMTNKLIKPAFYYIKTSEWTQRNPFKD